MRVISADRLEKACIRLGEAALDPATWPEIMEAICSAVGATGAALLQTDNRTADIPRTASADELLRHYFEHGWHTRDTRANRGVPRMLAGSQVVTDQELLTWDELRSDPFYCEAILPFGFQWFAGVGFRAGPVSWVLTLQRTPQEGAFEVRDKSLLAPLSQRLSEVASLSTAVGRIALSSATNALNAVRQPAIAIDRLGFVLDANPSAEALFDQYIRVKDRRLVVDDAEAKACLEVLVNCLRVTPDTAALPSEPIVIHRREKSPVILRTLPVHAAARTPFLGARAVLTLTTVEPRVGPKPALLSKALGLTPAEARLASIIAEGLPPVRAAEELAISKATARNQLRAIFAKTGTHRQGELVALLSRL